MKFTIARSTATEICTAVNACNAAAGSGATDYAIPSNESLNESDRLANISLRGEDEQIVVEINDEIVLRYLALYIKTFKLVTPIVTAVVGMWNAVQSLIKTDCEELIAFIKARKE